MAAEACRLLELPFEVRQSVYEYLLINLVIHTCPDEHQVNHRQHGPNTYGDDAPLALTDFNDDLMKCSGLHYQSLIKPGKWSNVCAPSSDCKASDILHFMLSCQKIYDELEPLFWSNITLAVGLPAFGMFFERYLSIQLHSRTDKIVPRASVLSKLILALPRTDELASKLSHNRHYQYGAHALLEQKVKFSLGHLTRSCPSLRSIEIVMDATQLNFAVDPQQIIAYVRHDVEDILRFENLEEFKVTYSGAFPYAERSIAFNQQLEACEGALWECVTRKGEPLDPKQDRTGWLGDDAVFEEEESPLNEFCQRASRRYNKWWMGLGKDEKKAISGELMDGAA